MMVPRAANWRPAGIGATAARSALVATLAAAPAVGASAQEHAHPTDPVRQAEICTEAAKRYRELRGKAMDEEPVNVIAMYKHTFCPTRLDVKAGSTLRFVNVDKRTTHSFWFRDAGKPESERFLSGEGADFMVDLPPGRHVYLCGPHYEREGMIGEITVKP